MSQTFSEFLSQGWNDHATSAELVAKRLPDAYALITGPDEVIHLASFATHVFGEHLGLWQDGIDFLETLQASPFCKVDSEADIAIKRLTATLSFASGDASVLKSFARTDQIRILAMASSALSAQGETDRASQHFKDAVALAAPGLAKDDPANRALAVTGNNLASALEETPGITPAQVSLMILAAETGRKYWEIAGTWNETMYAEYRLANSYLVAKHADEARKHAKLCIELSVANSGNAAAFYSGYEALTLAEKARGDEPARTQALAKAREYYAQLSADEQEYYLSSFEKLSLG